MKPKVNVSIVSANFNNEEFLEDYFQSIRISTVYPIEIILIDDGSNDQSLKIIDRYKNLGFLKLIINPENLGFAKSLNLGIKHTRGKYIMRLDPDDFINSKKIEKQYDFLEKNPNIDLVGTNVFYFNNYLQKAVFRSCFPHSSEEIRKLYMKGFHGMAHSTIMARSDIFCNYKYSQSEIPAEEYDLFSRMVSGGIKMANLSEPLTFYRLHKNNISHNQFKKALRKTHQLRKRIFNKNTSAISFYMKLAHLFYYRRGLMVNSDFSRYLFFIIAVLFHPGKIVKRLKSIF